MLSLSVGPLLTGLPERGRAGTSGPRPAPAFGGVWIRPWPCLRGALLFPASSSAGWVDSLETIPDASLSWLYRPFNGPYAVVPPSPRDRSLSSTPVPREFVMKGPLGHPIAGQTPNWLLPKPGQGLFGDWKPRSELAASRSSYYSASPLGSGRQQGWRR